MTARLDVVGTGIDPWVHATGGTTQLISAADEVLYLVADPLAARWVERLNPAAESLGRFYTGEAFPPDVYATMVGAVMEQLRAGRSVCMVLYGHPGVFASPGHDAIAAARAEGFEAAMHPAVSSVDCLYADLGIDPGRHGCLSFEASHFVAARPPFDTSVALILWQIGVVGAEVVGRDEPPPGMPALVALLAEHYGEEHEVVVYEAATQPIFDPRIDTVRIADLGDVGVSQVSTLYVPPVSRSTAEPTS